MFTDPYKAETSSDSDDEVIVGESQLNILQSEVPDYT